MSEAHRQASLRYYRRNKARVIKTGNECRVRRKEADPEQYLTANRVYSSRGKHKTRTWLAALKEKPCVDCGGMFPACCMHFDHVRGVKKYNVGAMLGMSRSKILNEIAKCDLVCANCHAIRTWGVN